jgi:hypothetical protein
MASTFWVEEYAKQEADSKLSLHDKGSLPCEVLGSHSGTKNTFFSGM